MVSIRVMLDEGLQNVETADRRKIIEAILDEGQTKSKRLLDEISKETMPRNTIWEILTDWYRAKDGSLGKHLKAKSRMAAMATTDAEFLVGLEDLVAREPILQDAANELATLARTHLCTVAENILKNATGCVRRLVEGNCKNQILQAAKIRAEEDLRISRLELTQRVTTESQSDRSSCVDK